MPTSLAILLLTGASTSTITSTATPAPQLNRLHGLSGTDGIEITAFHLFSELPPLGYHPIAISIRNDSGATRTWSIRTRGERGYSWSTSDVRTMEVEVSVDAGSERRFEILAPLPSPSKDRMGQMSLRVEIDGFGVRGGADSTGNRIPGEGEPARPTVGLSATLAARDPDRFAGASAQIRPVYVFPNALPSDWKAFVGLDALWLTGDDVRSMAEEAEAALLDWVAQGGQLFVCFDGAMTPPPYGLRRAADLDGERYGLGRIAALSWSGVGITENVTAAATSIPIRDLRSREHSDFHKRFDPISVNRAVMLIFMIVFGIAIGPVNLFVLAPARKRWRLLWTTPLISAAASVGLAALILVQDGVGGTGHRRAIVLSMAGRNRDVITQEQVSKTGVLLGRRFPAVEGSMVEQVDFEGADTTCSSSSRGHSGDFFGTRRVQGQRIERVEPSRARIEVVEGLPSPKVASTLPVHIEKLYYVAPNGSVFMAEHLGRGARVSLVESSADDLDDFLNAETALLTPLAFSLVRARWAAPGWFYGATSESTYMKPTLGSINWIGDRTLIFGPAGGP